MQTAAEAKTASTEEWSVSLPDGWLNFEFSSLQCHGLGDYAMENWQRLIGALVQQFTAEWNRLNSQRRKEFWPTGGISENPSAQRAADFNILCLVVFAASTQLLNIIDIAPPSLLTAPVDEHKPKR